MRLCLRILALLLLTSASVAGAAPVDRQLKMLITIEAEQSWRNLLQWSKGKSSQRYEIDTTLRSDGRLFPENLLDQDQAKRLKIREEYLTRRGLEDLKRLNGGKLPANGDAMQAFSNAAANEKMECQDNDLCSTALAERFAALAALQQNSAEELEAWLAEGENIPNGRFLYFFGYAGCPNTLKMSNQTHIYGEQASDKKKEKLVPFVMDRVANSRGTVKEQSALCRSYVATVDTKTGEIFIENAYIPSPIGTTTLKIGQLTTNKEAPLPIPAQALDWTSAVVRQAKDSGSASTKIAFTRPLDGNATVLGDFTGDLNVTFNWSFKAAGGTAKK